MKIKIINGANLNMLGLRNVDIYGSKTYNDLERMVINFCNDRGISCDLFVSNFEGEIINSIHDVHINQYDGLIINPGAFTHYSYAIRDALEICTCPIVEVHISDIYKREDFRKNNVINDVCTHSIVGMGLEGYILAIKYILENDKR